MPKELLIKIRYLILDLIQDCHRAFDETQRLIAEEKLNHVLHIQTLANCGDYRALAAVKQLTQGY